MFEAIHKQGSIKAKKCGWHEVISCTEICKRIKYVVGRNQGFHKIEFSGMYGVTIRGFEKWQLISFSTTHNSKHMFVD